MTRHSPPVCCSTWPIRSLSFASWRAFVKPGGRVVLMDWDWETIAVTHPDRGISRDACCTGAATITAVITGAARKLLGYLLDAGLHNPTVIPVVTLARDEAAALTGTLWRAAEAARDRGGITPNEHDAWVGELKRQIATGRFLASIVYFIVRGERTGE